MRGRFRTLLRCAMVERRPRACERHRDEVRVPAVRGRRRRRRGLFLVFLMVLGVGAELYFLGPMRGASPEPPGGREYAAQPPQGVDHA
jgi:hypothetical protein